MSYKDKSKQKEFQRKWMAKRREDWFTANGPCINIGMEASMQTSLQKILYKCEIPTRSYSGRGMYGAGCLAFTLDTIFPASIGEVFARVLERAVANPGVYNVGELARSLSYMKQDSMGRNQIYYFPGVTFDSEGQQPDNNY